MSYQHQKELFGADPMKISWGNGNQTDYQINQDRKNPKEWKKNKPAIRGPGSANPYITSLNNNTNSTINFINNEGKHQTIRDTKTTESHAQDRGIETFLNDFDSDLYYLSLQTWKNEILSGSRDKYEEETYKLVRKFLGIKELRSRN